MGLRLLWLLSLSGCSLIYNPADLPDKGSMPPDAAIADANPALLHIDDVKSPPLLEGAGQDGSSPAVLVLYGGHLTQGATVEIAPTTPNANVIVSSSVVSVAEDGNSLAAVVSAAYMDTVGEAAGEIPLTVTVSEPGAPPATIDWKLLPLDELTTAGAQAAPPANKQYARVDVAGDLIFPPGPRVVIRAVGRIAISGVVRANATGQMAGAGGCNGGAATAPGACFGGGGANGGGGGFADKGGEGDAATAGAISGDPLLRAYDGGGMEVNRGGGGGGGGAAIGGGGGGAIEITAGGTLSLGTIEAKGANGANGLGRGGGGGAGGAVLLRAGAKIMLPSNVSLVGGEGGNGGLGLGGGGAGSVGRWRYDANDTGGTASLTPAPKRGPMLAKPANPIFETKRPQLVVNADPVGSGASVSLVVQFPDGTTDTKNVNLTSFVSTVIPELAIGHNTVCVVVAGGNFASPEARNCIDVAFVP